MKLPLSWIKDYVEITLPLEDLAHAMTMAGLEIEEIRYVGLPMPDDSSEHGRPDTKISGLSWDPEKLVVAEIREVMPHPNADRLVLCRLYDGVQEQIVLTGAPNLFEYKGQGPLAEPLKVAYAREGARLYDGHQPGQVLTTLKKTKIRGVESSSMVCSEKELGISDEHEGIIILDSSAPTGVPLVDYMGDAVLDIAITPNIARDANVVGVAREISAITGAALRLPSLEYPAQGETIEGLANIEIREPELNPRFVLGLIRDVEVGPSPYEVQRRLRLAGMRPINNIVDATNYAMLELGEPLHAFDYDILVQRAGGQSPAIITRQALPGETLTTLDGVERKLDEFTVLVTDTAGPLSIAGVMGGAESEVTESTRNILLEGAAWNFINIRRTVASQRLNSEASYRFSRGVHPALAESGVRLGLALMQRWADGQPAPGLVDHYPLPPVDPVVEITAGDVRRWLGIDLSLEEIAGILYRLEFAVEIHGDSLRAKTPPIRLDIGQGVIGKADLIEEIARIYGYERIPETRMSDELPPVQTDRRLELEERLKDLLVSVGFQEVVSYRMTSPAREERSLPEGERVEVSAACAGIDPGGYVRLANPISADRDVLRQSQLASLLETVERNARLRERITLFEVGKIFRSCDGDLPDELPRLTVAITGPRELPFWEGADTSPLDFYDLKGMLAAVFDGLHLQDVRYEPGSHPSMHPGKTARVLSGEQEVGYLGELHPLVGQNYELPGAPLLVGDFDLDAILAGVPTDYPTLPVPVFPPAVEDLAVIVDEAVPAGQVVDTIYQGGGKMVAAVDLFDVYRGEQIGAGKKSLAFSVSYQAPDRTLTEKDLLGIRQRIIRRLEQDLGAYLRS